MSAWGCMQAGRPAMGLGRECLSPAATPLSERIWCRLSWCCGTYVGTLFSTAIHNPGPWAMDLFSGVLFCLIFWVLVLFLRKVVSWYPWYREIPVNIQPWKSRACGVEARGHGRGPPARWTTAVVRVALAQRCRLLDRSRH